MTEEIKNTYQKILELNRSINLRLNNFPENDFDDYNEQLQSLISEKEECTAKLISFKQTLPEEFNRIKTGDIKEIVEQITDYEEENLRLINEKKTSLSEEINKINRTEKALSGYKFNKYTDPKIIDEIDAEG